MQISIIAIAREKLPFSTDVEEYLKRFNWQVSFKFLKSGDEKNIDLQKEKEGKILLQEASKSKFIIALDERGKTPNSNEFAKMMEEISWQYKEVAFVIGGAFGLSEEVRQKADRIIALSKLTFPHRFIPLILTEQLYRSYTILNNHPYHK